MSLFLMELISYIKLKAILNILFPPLKNKTKNPGVLGEEMGRFESLRVLHIKYRGVGTMLCVHIEIF